MYLNIDKVTDITPPIPPGHFTLFKHLREPHNIDLYKSDICGLLSFGLNKNELTVVIF